jgi:hypothetical protein
MEVPMTRTDIHHTLSAFAAVALVAGSSASAQNTVKGNANYVGETQLSKETPKGLATKKGHSQRAQQNPDYDYAMITINRNLGQKTPRGLPRSKSGLLRVTARTAVHPIAIWTSTKTLLSGVITVHDD